MKKLLSNATACILSAVLMLTGFTNLSFAVGAVPETETAAPLGASAACDGHTLGTFSGVPACVNENGDLHVCENNFPDENFRNYLSTMTIGYTGYYEKDRCPTVLQVENRDIYSLQGIEFFPELKNLRCYSNNITELNLTKNIELAYLGCLNNNITSLDVSMCPKLKELDVRNNSISGELVLGDKPVLEKILCHNNQITVLDLSRCPALIELVCNSNTLSVLDTSNCDALTELECYNNRLTRLDVNKCTALTKLHCYSNQLTELDVSKNTALTSLICHSNQLTELDVSKNTALIILSCYSNQLTELDVSNNTALTNSDCNGQNAALTLYEKNGKWIADLNTIVSKNNFARIKWFSQGAFDSGTGLITFDNKPSSFTYTYNYDVGNDYRTMSVTVNLTDHVHSYGEWQVRTPATCTEKGEEYRTCACGEEETREITPLGHSFTRYTSDNNATCTENGTETAKCDRCDATDTRTAEGSALGHDWETEFTIDEKPTCTKPGSKSHHCTRCDAKTDITEIPANGHSYGEWIVEKPASMTEDGLEVRICSVCREREERILPAGDYLPGDVNDDGIVNDKDAEYLLYHVFHPQQYQVRQDCDYNKDGIVNDKDAEYLLYHIFFKDDYPLYK